MANKHPIRIHELYRSIRNRFVVEIIGKKGAKFSTRILTDKPGVYNGSHTLSPQTIYKGYELVTKDQI